jgi:hypothetical protein
MLNSKNFCKPNLNEIFPTSEKIKISRYNSFPDWVLDLKGVVLNSGEATNTKSIGEELPHGIYLLKIENATKKRVIKMVKN